MSDWLLIIISAVFVNNFVLVQFLGLCPFMGVSNRVANALGLGIATTFVLTLAALLSHLLHTYILVPLDVQYLRIIGFIFIIAVVVQFTELVMRRHSPLLHQVLGLYLPLITTNCAVLGVALLTTQQQNTLFSALLQGFGAAVGFTLVLILFAAMRMRLDKADIPRPFQGAAIAFVTAGILSLAFMGFAGVT
jgi:Na+-translocating ferredoxin:NAD+ oxidoreductase subunit A